ncbi:MAG TPA: glycoside hydrolase family 5 protein [Polyangiaceae bacterium]|nr:glycoside hydrolase family 5 protein [Polyangiaceae bacterium]
MTLRAFALCLGVGALFVSCQSTVAYRGVNLASAEFGEGTLPGTHGVHYVYPDPSYAGGYTSQDYFITNKGMSVIRLPFRWERLQPVRRAALDAAELGRLTTTVSHITGKGASVILDPHNYARYQGQLIGSAVPNADFADFWARLAAAFRGNSRVIFGLMNEPHSMPTEQWLGAANAAIAAIRNAAANNLILVPGNAWTGAHSWSQNWYGTPNATVMLNINDPGNNFAYEVHQYLDSDSSGTNEACVSANIGSQRLQGFTNWLKQNGKRGFLGEFGAGSSATCLSALDDMLAHVHANPDVWLGWTYWAAGPWWASYFMSLEPRNGADAPQMAPLARHL